MGGQVSTPCKVEKRVYHSTGKSKLKSSGRRCVQNNKKRTTNCISKFARSTNPFILFYLRMQSKRPKKPIIEVARKAGKLWCKMSISQRKKYIELAQAEKRRQIAKRNMRKSCKYK